MGENIGFLGSGDALVRRKLSTGAWGNWWDSGGAVKLELTAESEIKSQVLKGRGTYGQSADAVTLPKDPGISITFIRPNRGVLAAHLLGEAADFSITGASVTDEEHTCPAVGEGIMLAYRDVSSVTVTEGGSDLVAGTDYELNAKAGFIKNLAGTPDATWTVDYTYASGSGFKITGVTTPKVELQIKFDGKNMVDDSDCVVDVWSAQVAPSGGWDILSDDHSQVELTGICNTPSDKSDPYEVYVYTG